MRSSPDARPDPEPGGGAETAPQGGDLRQEIKLQIMWLLKARIPVPRQLSEEGGKTIQVQPLRLVRLQQNKARQSARRCAG